MSMRAVDLQTILYRMQEIDRTTTQVTQQPKVAQEQLVQQFTQNVQTQQRQVYTAPRAEGKRIRENEGYRERQGGRRRTRRDQEEEPEEKPAPPSPNLIDVRV